jgi:very-short-patch-repair endonuclease
MPKKPPKGKSLAEVNPELAKQWHPTKNRDLTPSDFFAKSGIKVWWKCEKGDDHEWESIIVNRTRGRGCPMCSNYITVKSNCLVTTHPQLATQWHPTKNNTLVPENFTHGSHQKIWWKCDKGADHEWITSIKSRANRGTNCPVCAGKKTVHSNSIATTHPELVKEWHPTKNGTLTPSDVIKNSHKMIWWQCPKYKDHVWKSIVSNRTRHKTICSVCDSRTVVKSTSLEHTHPELAKQWHPTKNGDLKADQVVAGSHYKVWWKCNKGIDHEWLAVIGSRVSRGCPFCDLTPQSKQELTITFELIEFFKDINPKGFKARVMGKLWSIDIYIPQLKLGIEFDGSYWHKDKRSLDKLKTEKLEEEGFEIFRVREEPLKRIFDDDIMSKQPFNAKQVVNDILTQIMSRYTLDAKKIAKIETYIAKKELQNEKGLDKYIDMILTEKAEKKK